MLPSSTAYLMPKQGGGGSAKLPKSEIEMASDAAAILAKEDAKIWLPRYRQRD